MHTRPVTLTLAGALTLAACNQQVIPHTDVPDTSENREIVYFVDAYREAMNQRDPAAILRLVSADYFDDNGTPGTADDVDYDRLQEMIARLDDDVTDVRYDIRYRRVIFLDTRIYVDVTYAGRFKVRRPNGEESWERRVENNRLELVRESGELRIISGL